MSIVSNPRVTANLVTRGGQIPEAPQSILAIAQKAALGSAPADTPVTIGNNGAEDTLFGKRSMLATVCRTVRKINKSVKLVALPLDDPSIGAAKATATITIDSVPTANGNLSIAVQSEKYHTFTTGVVTTDTTVDIAGRLVSLITADDKILCTAENSGTNVVTLTASHDGTELNSLSLTLIETVVGLGVTLSPFTGGAGAVTLPDLNTALGDERYQTIIYPGSYDLTTIKDFIDARFNVTNAVIDGSVFCLATVADTQTAIATSLSLNTQNIAYGAMPNRNTAAQKGTPLVELNLVQVAFFAAVRALKLTPGENIAPYQAGTNVPSTFGGVAKAASPYQQTPFEDLPVIRNNLGWSTAEQNALKAGGVWFFGNNSAGSSIVVSEVVTTYRTTPGGVQDATWFYQNAVDTSSAVREYFFLATKAEYVQAVLSTGGVTASPNKTVTENIVRSFLIDRYDRLAIDPYTLVQNSKQAKRFFANTLQVNINLTTGLINVTMYPPLVSQVRTIDETIAVGFSTSIN